MRIGVFGGSFNPPHNMHINIAEYLINNGYLDNVIFVPTSTNYKYKNNLVSNMDRYNMLSLATSLNDYLSVSDYELKDYLVYTYQTLDYFSEYYKDDEIYFICGADNLSYIDKWMEGNYILNNFNIIAINRDNIDISDFIQNYKNITECDLILNDLSSTMIREKIKNGEDVSDYINPKVLNYIKERRLYL